MLTAYKNNKELLLLALGLAGIPVDRVTEHEVTVFCEDDVTPKDPATFVRFSFNGDNNHIEFVEAGLMSNYHD